MPCNWPCKRCSVEKDYCYSCWQDVGGEFNFLMTTEAASTCKGKCDDGWTTDGDVNKVCQTCSASCETCLDNGNAGDKNECVTCAAGYDLRIGPQYR